MNIVDYINQQLIGKKVYILSNNGMYSGDVEGLSIRPQTSEIMLSIRSSKGGSLLLNLDRSVEIFETHEELKQTLNNRYERLVAMERVRK